MNQTLIKNINIWTMDERDSRFFGWILLENGRIAEVGTHTELLKKRGIYYNLVMAQRQTSKLTSEAQAALDRQ